MKQKYKWRRFWSPPDAQLSLLDNGFLQDPTEELGKYLNPDLIAIDATNSTNCLILLGEPGIGKSVEIKGLYKALTQEKGDDKTIWLDLKNFMTPDSFIKELENNPGYQHCVRQSSPLYLFLDSLDEGLFSFPHFANAFTHILTSSKGKTDNLFIRISCRTAVWPLYFEDNLRLLWKGEKLKKYELCPLIKDDVVTALKTKGIDENKFITELQEKGVVGLAGKPLTLNMLMDVFEQRGSLPNNKAEIYTTGCNLLLQESDPSKKTNPSTKPKLDLRQRTAIAERIAISTIIGGKTAIIISDTSNPNDGELSIATLHGKELLNDTPRAVGDNEVLEVLNTTFHRI